MLKIGVSNIIENASVSSGSPNPSMPAVNVQVPTLQKWQSVGLTDTLTITFTATSISHIAIFNTNIESVTVTGKLATATVFSDTYTTLDGLTLKNLYIDKSGTIDELVLTITNTTDNPYIGYIWLGDEVKFDFTAFQMSDESGSTVAISKGGVAEQNPSYQYRSYSITLAYTDYTTLRSDIRQVFAEGYAKPRSFVLTGDCLPTDVVLGIFDSGKVGYDVSDIKSGATSRKAQATIGFTEVSGGSSR